MDKSIKNLKIMIIHNRAILEVGKIYKESSKIYKTKAKDQLLIEIKDDIYLYHIYSIA
jgi:hypothetical protein